MSRKKYSFAELEGLIKQARRAGKKQEAWEAGRQKLLAKQKVRRQKKEARSQVLQAQENSRLQRQQRLGEIYDYFRREINKQNPSQSEYFTPHLSLPPDLARGLRKKSRQHPDYDFYAEFRRSPYLVYRLNKAGRDYLISQTNQAYQEELADQASRLRYLKDKIGELVPDSEIELDKYGNPKIKEGQVIRLESKKPGRMWSVYKNVPSLEEVMKKEVHDEAHRGYMEEYGTELEKDIFFNRRKNPFLCVIEAMVEHREANKQWHWSLQGEKTNVAVDYKQELQEQLRELGRKYPVYQKSLKNFAQKLGKVESEEKEWEEMDGAVDQKQLNDYYTTEELLKPESNLIPKLLTNEIVISPAPIIPFCQGCYNSPKPIPTVQQTQQFLGSILPTINRQLPNQEKLNSIFLVHQDKPAS
ncbi:43645_t:CDS:2 [Gigaspora margarita]|uniref:43645_t:CDS:1 n=1 Tax=Gigaspora margarita TaxID=4874 RepID=A0ABN7UYK0_GIGMA|nr:43645_t:CDS:2 [Gigaspora margarita]